MSLRLRLALALTFVALLPMMVVAGRPLLNAQRNADEEGARRLDAARRQAAVLIRREQADLRGRVERAASDLAADRSAPRALQQGPASTVRALARLLGERHGLDHLELRGPGESVLAVFDPLGSGPVVLPGSLAPDDVAIADLPLAALPPPRDIEPEPETGDDAPPRPLPANPPEHGMAAIRSVQAGGEQYEILGVRRLGAPFLDAVAEVTGAPAALVAPDGRTLDNGTATDPGSGPPRDAGMPLIADVPLAPGSWSVRVAAAPGDAAAVRRDLLASLVSVAPFALLAAALLGILLAEGISRPVRALAARAESISAERAGEMLTPLTRDGDEVRGLTRSFDRMLEALSQSEVKRLSAERIAAWQEVARRVAHEVRNALSPIRLAVENLRRTRQRAPEEIDRALGEEGTAILEEVESLRRLVEEFSLFARLPAPQCAPCDLTEVARQSLALAAPRIAAMGVTVDLEDGGRPHVVHADAGFLGRALGNVVANALDAMERSPEKRLRIALRTAPGGTPAAATPPGVPGIEEIEVRDSGPGFAAEVAERMFEPYVTTRSERGGTGLGLTLVQRVVADHGGSVSAGTAPGGGAFVLIRLPVAGPPASGAKTGASPAAADVPRSASPRHLRSA
ncbi:MAG TPA: ATP-binding protein [Candidatus Polarisedimenticolia bacterium]|nr:ATP-binding protein [Candidatus Polarisedimenticolia bacterium]